MLYSGSFQRNSPLQLAAIERGEGRALALGAVRRWEPAQDGQSARGPFASFHSLLFDPLKVRGLKICARTPSDLVPHHSAHIFTKPYVPKAPSDFDNEYVTRTNILNAENSFHSSSHLTQLSQICCSLRILICLIERMCFGRTCCTMLYRNH